MTPRILGSLVALGLALGAVPARADVVTDWNGTVTSVTLGGSSYLQFRAYAYTHAAIHDAVNAVDRRFAPYAVDLKAPPGTSMEAAAVSAAHGVLTNLVPEKKAAIDAALTASLARIPEGQARTNGIAIGKQVAERLLALRADDGVNAKVDLKLPAPGPGVWQQTPGWTSPLLSQWPQVKPMVVKNLTQFDLGGPPALTSARFARDYDEVKAVGARNSTARTADQTAAAIFWTTQTMAPWNAAALAASHSRNLGVAENARLFALLNISAFDSGVVVMEQKYRYNFWRPYNAIRNPGGPGNPVLAGDPGWEPLLLTPGFPEYPSGHCVTSGAAAQALREVLGSDEVAVSYTYPVLFGVTRSWKSLTEMEKEVENARVWGGIHYRTADETGSLVGHKIAQYAAKSALVPVARTASK